ncbi:Uncharacterised protein [Enterobacter cloacae]|nr:Uncharacterised protein [Enterobacter cloacae]
MLSGNLFERHLRTILQPFAVTLFQFLNVLLERRRLFKRMAQVQANNAQRQCEEERDTPAPVEEVIFTHHG